MSIESFSPIEIEPERYELRGDPLLCEAFLETEIGRRAFLKSVGGGIVVLLALPAALGGQETGGRRGGGRGAGRMPGDIGGWLHIGEDGAVTVFTGKVEVGQGIRTSLAQAVAEELRAPIETIHLVMADTALTPFDQGTMGSRTTPDMASRLRKVAAAARELLIDLAAREWSAERGLLGAAGGKIVHSKTGQTVAFGTLTHGRKLVETVNDSVQTTTPAEWKVAGQPVPRVNGRELVTGKHRYTSDIKLPGMLYGKVLRPASFGASLSSVDTKEAEALEGVIVVRDGDLNGVVAPSERQAARALAALEAEWKTSSQPSDRDLVEILRGPASARGRGGRADQSRGSMDDGLAAADSKLESTYTVAYIAHAPLEPRAAVAEWKGDELTVYTGTQRPFGVRGDLARAFTLSEDRVRVIVPDTGSAYGGKHSGEVAIEAARLARAAKKPVKVVWTREEEFTWAYFRPAGVIDVRSGVKKDGTITAWEFHNYNSGGSAIRPLYDIPNQWIAFHQTTSPLRQGSYRALAATANHFARESHIDELARSIGMDPLELRRKNLKEPRLIAVLNAAAERFGWGKSKPPAGRGFGIAGGSEKGSYVACCAQVMATAADGGKAAGDVKVERIVTAFECGAVVNPDNLRNQIEGAVIQGMGGALFEAIRFEGGKISNPRFSEYRVPRVSDIPALETVLVDRKDLPSTGAGETPIVCVAPAIANAIADACGVRLRSMPMLGAR